MSWTVTVWLWEKKRMEVCVLLLCKKKWGFTVYGGGGYFTVKIGLEGKTRFWG